MVDKNLAVVIDTLAVGGVAKAAIDFIRCLSAEDYNITVYVREIESIRGIETIQNVAYCPWGDEEFIGAVMKEGRICDVFRLLKNKIAYYLHFRNFGKRMIDRARCRAKIPATYDCVIGYQMVANDVTVMALEKIDAPRKILWLHGQKKFTRRDIPYYDALYSKADKIVCVSKDTELRFQSLMNRCTHKTVTIHNFYNIEKIKELAGEPVEGITKRDDEVLIVSVGRISKEKGFDRVPEAAKKLASDGYKFRWLIVGDGNCRKTVEDNIRECALTEQVLLLGHQSNPYPYMSMCDVYVQPSYSEGYCTSTVEAKILGKPVVTTNVPGMNEQFENGQNGLIVESSIDGIYYGVRQLIQNIILRDKITEKLCREPISNDDEITRTVKVIEGV